MYLININKQNKNKQLFVLTLQVESISLDIKSQGTVAQNKQIHLRVWCDCMSKHVPGMYALVHALYVCLWGESHSTRALRQVFLLAVEFPHYFHWSILPYTARAV